LHKFYINNMEEAYRWLKKEDEYVQIDEKNVLLWCHLDENHNHVISENAIKVLNLKDGDAYTLIYAEPLDKDNLNEGFMEGLVSWNVIFDGIDRFVPDESRPDIEFIEFVD
jgi:hypothetical protein